MTAILKSIWNLDIDTYREKRTQREEGVDLQAKQRDMKQILHACPS